MSTSTWLFDENIWIGNIFINGIPGGFILITHVDITLFMTFQRETLSGKTIWSDF
jgi:hypothetical protein